MLMFMADGSLFCRFSRPALWHTDAVAAVHPIFEQAAATGVHLIAQVKANQPALHHAIAALCDIAAPLDSTQTADKKRRCRDETPRVRAVAARIGSEPLGARIASSGSVRTGIQGQDSPLCQSSCRADRIGTFGGADSKQWLGTDRHTGTG